MIDICHVLLWLMSYENTRGAQSAPQLVKGCDVCCHVYVTGAHKRTCPTTVLLSAMSECASDCCIEGLDDK